MDLDFTPVYTRQQTIAEVTRDVTYADLQRWTAATYDALEAALAAWPAEPHLDVMDNSITYFGPMNAIARYAIGLAHSRIHVGQMQEFLRQVQAADTPTG